MSYSIPASVTNMISTIPKLNDSNWFEWSKKMKMAFLGADIDRKKLESLGCKINDIEFKDILLMHLDSSYHSVCTTILAQKTEPSLDDIKSILTSSAAADIIEVKVEDQEIALRTC